MITYIYTLVLLGVVSIFNNVCGFWKECQPSNFWDPLCAVNSNGSLKFFDNPNNMICENIIYNTDYVRVPMISPDLIKLIKLNVWRCPYLNGSLPEDTTWEIHLPVV